MFRVVAPVLLWLSLSPTRFYYGVESETNQADLLGGGGFKNLIAAGLTDHNKEANPFANGH